MNTMSYKNYCARIEFDAEDKIFVGHIVGIKDVVGFHGASVNELETAFQESVDQYLYACEKLGQAPNKPYSGRMMLRMEPEIHNRISVAADLEGISTNQWVVKRISKELADA